MIAYALLGGMIAWAKLGGYHWSLCGSMGDMITWAMPEGFDCICPAGGI